MLRLANPLRWLGGRIDVRVEIETLGAGGGIWDVGEWDVSKWATFEWTDITGYVQEVQIERGQERWGQRFAAGSLTLKLDNRTGLFTPEIGSLDGVPWRPGRSVRVIVNPDPEQTDLWVPLFTGAIDDSSDSFNINGKDVIATVRALDAFGRLHAHNPPALETPTGVQTTSERVHAALDRMGWPVEQRVVQTGLHTMQTSYLAQTTLEECQRAAEAEGGALWADKHNRIVFKNRDWLQGGSPTMDDYAAMVLALEPLAYWRMGDDTDHTVDSTGNGHTLTWSGSPTTGAEGVMDDDVAVSLDGINDYATVADAGDLNILGEMSIEFWMRMDEFTQGAIVACREAPSGGTSAWGVNIWKSQEGITFFAHNVALSSGTLIKIPLDEWVHVVYTREDHPNAPNLHRVRGYLNGQQVLQANLVKPTEDEPRYILVGQNDNEPDFFDGDISELAIYDKVLTPAQVLSLYEAKETGVNTRSINVQGYLGYLEEQEEGVPWSPITDAQTSWETARIRNDVQFARTGSTAYRVEDSDSQALYGKRSYQRLDFQNNSDDEVEFLADRYLAAFKDLRVRIDSVTLAAKADPNNEGVNRLFYETDFGDLMQAKVDIGLGWAIEKQAHVTSIRHRITPDDWQVTFALDDAAVAIGDDE